MRTLSAALQGHLAGTAHTRCNMLLIDLTDGTTIGATDHNRDIEYDIGDGVVTYSAKTGITTSDIALSASLEADNFEVTGPITEDDPYTLDAFLGGRWDRARARMFQVNWKSPSSGAIKLLAGNVSEARVEGGKFILSIRSEMDRYNQVVGRLITNNCDADFGDERCKATPVTVEGTVTAASSPMLLSVSYPGTYADDFYNKGTVIGLTGANAGVVREIFDWSEAGAIELFAGLPSTPEVGDTFTVRQGCGKSRADCMARNNIVNFRGYPEVPGSDQVLRTAIPGQGNG